MDNKPRVGLGVLIVNSTHEILLGKRIGAHGEHTWAPPGGHMEFGESFEDGAIREVLEETGLNITRPEFLAITNDYFAENAKHYVSAFMLAQYPRNQEVKNCEPHKVEEWRWFHVTNLPTNLFLPLQHLIAGQGYGKTLPEFINTIEELSH